VLLAAIAACVMASASGCHGGEATRPAELAARVHEVRTGEVVLHTVEVGPARGALRVVVHGGPGLDHGYLRPWLDALGRDARLVYVDLRGHGRSTPPADANGYTIAAASSDLASLVATIARDGRADFIGHDFGAAIVLDLAARHPERVRRVVLVDPLRSGTQFAAIADRAHHVLGAAGAQRLFAMDTPQGTLRDPSQLGERLRAMGTLCWHSVPPAPVTERMGHDVFYRAEADQHFRVALASWDGASVADQVRAPALVLSGSDDRWFPAMESRALADGLPHGHYVEIPAAGHFPFVEQPDRFLTAVEPFLRP
jgi:pimeloyl-ACP methyl ester carboxylesterase